MQFRQTPEGKNVFISIDSRLSNHNPLYKAWKTKSFTDGDITLHFILFDILFDPSIEMSFSEITDQVTPFLNARDFIFQAQNKTDLEEQKLLLQKAFDQLTTATNAVYTDLKTSADHLAKLTIRSFFRNTKQIQNYMNFLALDMQLATKFVGVYMQVLDYLGDNQSVQLISARYQYVLKDFFTKGIGKKNISADEILQMNYPYTESNRDSWYYLQKEMVPALESGKLTEVDRPVYLVSVEE